MQRPLQLVFRDMKTSLALETFIRDRVARLEQHHPRIIGCKVVADMPHRSSAGARPAPKAALSLSVEVEIPGRPLVVVKDAEARREAKDDQLAVVTHVFEAVERRLREAWGDSRKGGARHLADDGSIKIG
ncbi:MAG: HPF/RaiA family ribosome-associated protein [Ferrovibrio sp.]